MLLTLSIAVYNKAENLRLILSSCARQTMRDVEIIVADDGSGKEINEVVEDARRRHGLAIRHLWHEDQGWRKNVMLNNALRAASTDYMVFVDGDCLLHHRFLEDHWRARQPSTVLCGRRVELGERWASRVDEDLVASGRFERIGAPEMLDGLRGDAARVEDGLRLGPRTAALLHRGAPRLLGSNFSIARADLVRINGFDERYDGPGCGEDSDVQFRLELASITAIQLRHRAIQFHIHHPRTQVPMSSLERFEETKKRGKAWCEHGLSKGES